MIGGGRTNMVPLCLGRKLCFPAVDMYMYFFQEGSVKGKWFNGHFDEIIGPVLPRLF